jgi:hypothetical protein
MDPEASEAGMTHGLPAAELERLAQAQRGVLENRVVELRRNLKQRFDVKQNVRDHLWPAAGIAALLGAVLGYSLAGVFTRD